MRESDQIRKVAKDLLSGKEDIKVYVENVRTETYRKGKEHEINIHAENPNIKSVQEGRSNTALSNQLKKFVKTLDFDVKVSDKSEDGIFLYFSDSDYIWSEGKTPVSKFREKVIDFIKGLGYTVVSKDFSATT